jgi:hypothetical protein
VENDTPWLVEEDGSISGQATTLDGFVVVYDHNPLPSATITATTSLTSGLAVSPTVGSDYRSGGHIGALELDGVDAAQRIYMLLPDAGPVIGSIEYSSGFGISVITPNQQRIIFGGNEQIETKIAICRAMLAQLADKKWSTLDLRSTSRPAVQMVEDKKKS